MTLSPPTEADATAPAIWRAELNRLAETAGAAVVLVNESGPAGEFAAHDNSLCRLLQSTGPLCARDCASVGLADAAPRRCHAGLYVISAPLPGAPDKSVIGGRAFLKRADYQALTERFRQGDLQAHFAPAAFHNIIWSTPEALAELGGKLQRWANTLPPTVEAAPEISAPSEVVAEEIIAPEVVAEELVSEEIGAPEPLPAPLVPQLTDDLAQAAAAAALSLATAHNLSDVAFLWRNTDKFTAVYGMGLWAGGNAEIACDPRDAFLLRAAESKGSMRLRREKGRWDFVAGLVKPHARHPEAEIFPLLVNGEVKAAFLIAREGLTNEVRRAVADYGSQLAWPLEALGLRQESAPVVATDYVSDFASHVSGDDNENPFTPLLQHLARLLGVNRASLMVYQEESRELALKAGIGLSIPLEPELHVGLDDGLAGRAWQSGRPILARDLRAEGLAPAPAERAYRSNSLLCYPLAQGARRWGVLNLTDKADGGVFDEKSLSLLNTLTPQVGLVLERAAWQEKALRFEQMSITDPLTGLANRRYLMARLAEETSRAVRHQSPYCFMMIDLDDFKHYNDHNGHQAGDEALTLLAQGLKSTLRGVDVAARYGGEEFSILLPQTTLPEALRIGERIRQRIAQTVFPHGAEQPNGAVTVSIGIAAFGPQRNTPEAVIKAADEALYRAKAAGKNNVQVAE